MKTVIKRNNLDKYQDKFEENECNDLDGVEYFDDEF